MPKWDALSPWALLRKPCPGLGPPNGTQLPQRGSTGKHIPEFATRTGHGFPVGTVSETVSRNQPSEWDAVSAKPLKRKARPGFPPQSGTQFPDGHRTGNCVPKFTFRVGHAFRLSLDWETPSHS